MEQWRCGLPRYRARQCERYDRIAGPPSFAIAAGRDDDILSSISSAVRHRRGFAGGREISVP